MSLENVNNLKNFDEAKTAAAAAVLLNLAGGTMPYIRLLKLLYMADRLAWGRLGEPITGDAYVAMEYGPVLSDTYNLIKASKVTSGDTPWLKAIAPAGEYGVTLVSNVDEEELSDAEIAVLREIHNRFSKIKSSVTLVNHLHEELQEWDDPLDGSSAPIPVDTILQAIGKMPPEIGQILRDVEDRAYLRKTYGSK
jgi:uncharacterized phage-associated protein